MSFAKKSKSFGFLFVSFLFALFSTVILFSCQNRTLTIDSVIIEGEQSNPISENNEIVLVLGSSEYHLNAKVLPKKANDTPDYSILKDVNNPQSPIILNKHKGTIKATAFGGQTTVRVSSKHNPKVYKDVLVKISNENIMVNPAAASDIGTLEVFLPQGKTIEFIPPNANRHITGIHVNPSDLLQIDNDNNTISPNPASDKGELAKVTVTLDNGESQEYNFIIGEVVKVSQIVVNDIGVACGTKKKIKPVFTPSNVTYKDFFLEIVSDADNIIVSTAEELAQGIIAIIDDKNKIGQTATVRAKSKNNNSMAFDTFDVTSVGGNAASISSAYPLTLKTSNNQKNWNGTIEYSFDNNLWQEWTGIQSIVNDNPDNRIFGHDDNSVERYYIYLRGSANSVITGNSNTYKWVISNTEDSDAGNDVILNGNMQSLLEYNEDTTPQDMAENCFRALFYGCTKLKSFGSDFELPANNLTAGCYQDMFNGCSSLAVQESEGQLNGGYFLHAPSDIPSNAFKDMFAGCRSEAGLFAGTPDENKYYTINFFVTEIIPSKRDVKIEAGKSEEITFTFAPPMFKINDLNLSSSNLSIATVTKDNTKATITLAGNIPFKASTKITATLEGVSAEITVACSTYTPNSNTDAETGDMDVIYLPDSYLPLDDSYEPVIEPQGSVTVDKDTGEIIIDDETPDGTPITITIKKKGEEPETFTIIKNKIIHLRKIIVDSVGIMYGTSVTIVPRFEPEDATYKGFVLEEVNDRDEIIDSTTTNLNQGVIGIVNNESSVGGIATFKAKSTKYNISSYAFTVTSAKGISVSISSASQLKLKANSGKTWNGTIQYSFNNTSSWTEWNGGEITSSIPTLGDDSDVNRYYIYLKGSANTIITGDGDNRQWIITNADNTDTGNDVILNGNMQALLEYDSSKDVPTMDDSCFKNLFSGCGKLKSLGDNFELPMTDLSDSCYSNMFYNCTSLSSLSSDFKLPATQLKPFCYKGMFYGCSSLAVLKTSSQPSDGYLLHIDNSTEIEQNSLDNMFAGCKSGTGLFAGTPSADEDYYAIITAATSITPSESNIIIKAGDNKQITFAFTPANAYFNNISDLTFSVDNESVATIQDNGTIIVKDDAPFNTPATITATSPDGTSTTITVTCSTYVPNSNTDTETGDVDVIYLPDSYLPLDDSYEPVIQPQGSATVDKRTGEIIIDDETPDGTPITITIKKEGEEPETFTIIKNEIIILTGISVESKGIEFGGSAKIVPASFTPTNATYKDFVLEIEGDDENIIVSTAEELSQGIIKIIDDKTKIGKTATVKARSTKYNSVVSQTFTITCTKLQAISLSSAYPLTLQANNGKTWDGNIEYSCDNLTWSAWNGNQLSSSTQTLGADSNENRYYIYLRGINTVITGNSNNNKWVISNTESGDAGCDVILNGNMNALLEYDLSKTPTMGNYCFAYLFADCAKLKTLGNDFELPLTSLTQGCYSSMFSGCSSLAVQESSTQPSDGYFLKTPSSAPTNALTNMFTGCRNGSGLCSSNASVNKYYTTNYFLTAIETTQTNIKMKAGSSEDVTFTFTPPVFSVNSLELLSSDTSIATVTNDATKATITLANDAQFNDSATITATLKGVSATITVTCITYVPNSSADTETGDVDVIYLPDSYLPLDDSDEPVIEPQGSATVDKDTGEIIIDDETPDGTPITITIKKKGEEESQTFTIVKNKIIALTGISVENKGIELGGSAKIVPASFTPADATYKGFVLEIESDVEHIIESTAEELSQGIIKIVDNITKIGKTATVKARSTKYNSVVSQAFTITCKLQAISLSSAYPLTLQANNGKTWDGNIEYSCDNSTWSAWNGNQIYSSTQTLGADSNENRYYIYLRGINTVITGNSNNNKWVISNTESGDAGCDIILNGNMNALLEYDLSKTPTMGNYCFAYLFADCAKLKTLGNDFELPLTSLTQGCYSSMFSGCSSLAVQESNTQPSDGYFLKTPSSTPTNALTNMFTGCKSGSGLCSSNASVNKYYTTNYFPIAIEPAQTNIEMKAGSSEDVTFTFTPPVFSVNSLELLSSDTSIATVTYDATKATITLANDAQLNDSATITATFKGVSTTLTVTCNSYTPDSDNDTPTGNLKTLSLPSEYYPLANDPVIEPAGAATIDKDTGIITLPNTIQKGTLITITVNKDNGDETFKLIKGEVVELQSITANDLKIYVGDSCEVIPVFNPRNATYRDWTLAIKENGDPDGIIANISGNIVTIANDNEKAGKTATLTLTSVKYPEIKKDVLITVPNFKDTTYYLGTNNQFGLKFVAVKGGTFNMGDSTVTLDSFYICNHEVTQGEYKVIIGTNPSDTNKNIGNDYPVNNVSWYDAIVFCNKLSIAKNLTPCYSKNGKTDPSQWGSVPTNSDATWNAITCNFNADGFRLPTEAEWEFAARGGVKTKGYTYSGSNTVGSVAWYDGNAYSNIRKVKTKNANELGLYDMSGNVWEWCWNWYRSSGYGSGPLDNPHGPSSGSERVIRGGACFTSESYCRCDYRGGYMSPNYVSHPGFRVARSFLQV